MVYQRTVDLILCAASPEALDLESLAPSLRAKLRSDWWIEQVSVNPKSSTDPALRGIMIANRQPNNFVANRNRGTGVAPMDDRGVVKVDT